MTSRIIYDNGAFKNASEGVFTLSDRARYGDGVFDTMALHNGAPRDMDRHFDRLIRHAAVLGIDIEREVAGFPAIVKDLISRNAGCRDWGLAALNTIVSRGEGPRGLMPPVTSPLHILMRIAPVQPRGEPLNAVIAQSTRRNEFSPLSRIKSFNCGDQILALREARDKGANDAILLNTAGKITCAASGNVFALINGALLTPPLSDGVMDGITRALLLESGKASESSLTQDDLQTAEGLYIGNSIRRLEPVAVLDGRPLSSPPLTF